MYLRLKKIFISVVVIISLAVVSLTSNDEMPEATFKVHGKKIQYTTADYSWGKFFYKKTDITFEPYILGKNIEGVEGFPGIYIDLHFSDKPNRVEVIEHTSQESSYVYEQFGNDVDGYHFQVDTKYGERIFEIKAYWNFGQFISYIIKVKINKYF